MADTQQTTGYLAPTRQVRIGDLRRRKDTGEKWAMLTAYDYSTARSFSAAGVECLLVGDSAANVVFGYDQTQRISLDEMIYIAAAVVRGAGNALVIADLPFGTYEASDEQAVRSAAEMMRRSGAAMVKIEGGVRIAPRIRALVAAGIPVCAHIGFTPQSVNALSGFKVQGRGDAAAQLLDDVKAVAEAGADGQVLVWHDLAAFPADGHRPKFAKQWAQVGESLTAAAASYKREVAEGTFPAEEHCFTS